MTGAILPLKPDIALSGEDLVTRGLAIPGTVNTIEFRYVDERLCTRTVKCLFFELARGYTYRAGDQYTPFRDDQGVWDTNWIRRATCEIVDQNGNAVVTFVLHKTAGAFILKFFELPHGNIMDDFLS